MKRGLRQAFIVLAACRCMSAQGVRAFDVASIHPSPPGGSVVAETHPGGRVVIRQMSVRNLLREAYGPRIVGFIGEPAWFDEKYDIDAKAEGAGEMTSEQMEAPMLALMKDRFGLIAHEEQREQTVYWLEQQRAKLRLKAAVASTDGAHVESSRTKYVFQAESMPEFAVFLARLLRAPVADRTQLSGAFDFVLDFFPDGADIADGQPPRGISPADAVRNLGLSLREQKGSATVLVIEALHRPTAN